MVNFALNFFKNFQWFERLHQTLDFQTPQNLFKNKQPPPKKGNKQTKQTKKLAGPRFSKLLFAAWKTDETLFLLFEIIAYEILLKASAKVRSSHTYRKNSSDDPAVISTKRFAICCA